MSSSDPLFPVFLKLGGRPVVLVGGGKVASQKLLPLLHAGAAVTVIAPEISPEIGATDATLVRRPFEDGDLDGAWFVVAAATSPVNRQVAAAAESRRIFVNAVDDPPNASAYAGGVLRKHGVTLAVSTNGHAPALAGLLREGLEAVLPDEDLEAWVREATAIRRTWLAAGIPMEQRRPLLLEALNRLYEGRSGDRL